MILAVVLALAAQQVPYDDLPTRRERGRPQVGVPQVGTPQAGVPQTGNRREARPPVNPDGSPPRLMPGYRLPPTIVTGYGAYGIPFPRRFGLPDPAPGLFWQRVGNDAVLLDATVGTILEVRGRWFG